jgi:hypothetical protein
MEFKIGDKVFFSGELFIVPKVGQVYTVKSIYDTEIELEELEISYPSNYFFLATELNIALN